MNPEHSLMKGPSSDNASPTTHEFADTSVGAGCRPADRDESSRRTPEGLRSGGSGDGRKAPDSAVVSLVLANVIHAMRLPKKRKDQ